MTDSSAKGGQADAFEAELVKLAKHVVKKATLDDTPFPESVDALKVLTTYYGLRQKYKVDGDEDGGEASFDAFAAKLEEQAHGSTPVRSRSRRPS